MGAEFFGILVLMNISSDPLFPALLQMTPNYSMKGK